MEHDYNKLIEALNLVKGVCKSHAKCVECPMYSEWDTECMVKGRPVDWYLEEEVVCYHRVVK